MAKKMMREKYVQQNLGLSGHKGPRRECKPFSPGPNPDLPEFVKKHSTPYDSHKDKYDVEAFDKDTESIKTNPLYTLHTYWSKKDPQVIREYICHYTKPSDVVLDPTCGSGTTGLAALLEDRTSIMVDASPAAALLANLYCLPGSPEDVQDAYEDLIAKAGSEINELFATRCDRCGGEAITEFVVYSERYQCPHCGELVALFDCSEAKVPYQVGSVKKQKTELKRRLLCPHCLKKRGVPHRDFVISTRTKTFGAVPVLATYVCLAGCKPKRGQRRHDEPTNSRKAQFFSKYDLSKISELQKLEVPYWYPKRNMMDTVDPSKPWGVKWRAGTSNFKNVSELYTKRNLWALGALHNVIKTEGLASLKTLFFTALIHKCSNLMGYNSDGVGRVTSGTYYVAPLRMECRPTKYMLEALGDFSKHFLAKAQLGYVGGNVCISNGSACTEMKGIQDCSVDYIFTDPPYGGTCQYGELNFVWESWLGLPGDWLHDEIIVNAYRQKDVQDWVAGIRTILNECFRVLKPGRWLSLCYHDTDPIMWTHVQNMILDAGFDIRTVNSINPRQRSRNQILAEKVVKSDLVLNCRKPKQGEDKSEYDEVSQVSLRVRAILTDRLSVSGGQTRDSLWDMVLKRLLTRGQIAEHRFDDILGEVATRSESGRWFLKEEFEALSQNDIHNEEESGAAIERFVRLRCAGVPVSFAAQIALESPRMVVDENQLTQHIRSLIKNQVEKQKFRLAGQLKGVEFYDCLFFYLTRYLKGRPTGKTPRRNMADFLEEYLVRFRDVDKWLYRTPTQAESASLSKSRQSGLGRRIRQYVAFLRGDGEFPKEKMPDVKTLVAWLRHCSNFGLADEGVLLYEKGGLMGQTRQLPEEDRYDVEDYYAQCRRNATRVADEEEDADADSSQDTE